jgi:hypothetical protein
MTATYSLKKPRLMAEDGARDVDRYKNLLLAFSRRAERIAQEHGKRLQQFWADAADGTVAWRRWRKTGGSLLTRMLMRRTRRNAAR